MGEIIIKDSKYYFKPNKIEQLLNNSNNDKSENSSIDELDNLSWLVYKGDKIPFNKNKYKIKEGDIIKLGREWLLIRDIHISKSTKKKFKINKENTKENAGIFVSYHSQTNQSLNLNKDFNNFEEDNTDEEKDNDENDIEYDKEVKKLNATENNNVNTKRIFKKEKEEKSEKNKELISCHESEKNSEINKKNHKKICRICYMEEMDKKINPLIKPCKCSGSMKYIHYECLLHWLKTKVLISKNIYNNNGFFSIYSLNLIECELCKNHFTNYIKHNNKIYSLIDLEKKFDEEKKKPKKNKEKKGDLNIFNKKNKENNNNYIIFDTITPGKQDNKYRYLVKFDTDNIMRIGRALEMQLILNDISVSRNHCQLKLVEDGNIILEDNNSKFGSLVLLQAETIEILKGNTLTIQVGTNYLNISLKGKKNLFGCCVAEEIDIKHSYEKINSKAIKYDKSSEILNESITPENSDNEEEKNNINNKKELIDDANNKNKIIDIGVKNNDNKNKNKNNNNNNSTCVGSTIFAKDKQKEVEKKNKNDEKKENNESNSKENKKTKSRKSSIKSDNIIVSDEDSKSEENMDKKNKKNGEKEENKNLINEEDNKQKISSKE